MNEASYAAEAAFDDLSGTLSASIARAASAAAASDDYTDPDWVAAETASHNALNAASSSLFEWPTPAWHAARASESAGQCDLLRDIFGNTFYRVSVNDSWFTSDVIALATGIYQDSAFDRLPILADALQDAGCDNEDLLAHLRSDGPHVKGCWALDLILGKS